MFEWMHEVVVGSSSSSSSSILFLLIFNISKLSPKKSPKRSFHDVDKFTKIINADFYIQEIWKKDCKSKNIFGRPSSSKFRKKMLKLLCILTSFWVLHAPKSWPNHFFQPFFNLFCSYLYLTNSLYIKHYTQMI